MASMLLHIDERRYKMVVGRARQARKLTEGEEKIDSQNVQTVVEQYFASLQDRRNRHMLAEKYPRLSEASIEDIEKDAASWFSGFSAGIKLLDSKSNLPPLEMVLGGITKSFETETAA